MRVVAALLVAGLAAMPAAAQRVDELSPGGPRLGVPQPGVPQSSVVVLDRDALYAQSLFGRRVARDLEAASTDLADENHRIETELETEEKALTERRAGMDRAEFRQLAAEFDARVSGIRQTQDAKTRAIAQQGERGQVLFFEAANSVLVTLARETGALVILDRRMVIASADQVDITALARERIDAELGEGDGLRQTPPQRRPEPDTEPDETPDATPRAAPEAATEPAPAQ